MVIDKNMNLDQELEYFKDGSLAFAQNVIVSQDGLTIQNEPAIVNFLVKEKFDLVGFIACNEEFVLFSSDNKIVRISKDGKETPCDTNWKWQGGEVFGTFTYNVADELIIAVSERNPTTDCPLKVINLVRDKKISGVDDNIYTLTPDIPKSNMINVEYTLGNRVKKGKYNFFIKYHIDDVYETGWFPIGIPVFVYDNISSGEIKTLVEENIQIVDNINDNGVPNNIGFRTVKFGDYYNKDEEYTNNNVLLEFEINETLKYTHYSIGYIINTTAGTEGYKTNKFKINTTKIQIGTYQEPVSVDELTIGQFNLYNVNTLCNYKDRLYLANYKEENRNDSNILNLIDTSNIQVCYNKDDIKIPYAFDWSRLADSDTDTSLLNDDFKNQWKSKPGRFGVYNFFIHYVYPNGNYTDGIKINPSEAQSIADEDVPSNLVPLKTYRNNKGEILFKMPTDEPVNTKKLWFTGIKMYPQFVGYFISYEEPEYVQIGEGFLASDSIDRDNDDRTLYPLTNNTSEFNSTNWRFYYPEFNIVGGKTNIIKLYHTGNNNHTGGYHHQNNFIGSDEQYDIVKSQPIAPNDSSNIGREGYLKIRTSEKVTITHTDANKSFTAINNDYENLYLSDNKKLISLGYIEYQTYRPNMPEYKFTYGYKDVPYNYDFYRCFSSIIYFAKSGIIVNQTAPNPINATSGEEYYYFVGGAVKDVMPHVNIINYWHETHYPLFLKEVNQEPESIFYSYYRRLSSSKAEQYQLRNFVANPIYINDLYKLDNVYYDYTGKIFVNYDKTLVSNSLTKYDKTIRRSDVIQSESIVNSWRFFRPENYKIITEDKGAINNIVGIGNYLFAHCEHSLFLFDITDSLQALDKNVQLLQPDSFEVAYKEVFTADKGYGGLQDHESWICDEFGYIFFDKSAKKIYRFDGGQLKDMTDGIESLIKTIDTNHIWFGNDRPHNRIMVNFRGVSDNVILSYNIISNNWISTHSYIANYKFIGLKDKLYIPNVVGNNVTVTHYIDTEFNKFTLPVGEIDNDGTYKSFIDVVFTAPNYNKIKVLDFITYILNKEPADNFELLQLEIYTNCCYSGKIDISQERKKVSEYKKPYYDFERWNFNWFRNVIDKIENPDMIDRVSGRIHNYPQNVQRGYDNALMSGKYAVIRFSFKLMSKQVNVKDIHAYFKP